MLSLIRTATVLLITLSLHACAENSHHMNHNQHTAPTEAGQAGFAAIAEVVRLLQADADTDWSKVNVNALREHLLDMDRLVMGAIVNEQAIDNGVHFKVTGSGQVLAALQRMVPAHGKELNKMPEFTANTKKTDKGVTLTVTGSDAATAAKIKGLGFFGLMATGSHHQMHHYMMATGQGHKMHH